MIEDHLENKRLALKLQDDQNMASTEIGTMKKISQVFEANSKSANKEEISYNATPIVSNYGLFNIANF